VLNQQQNEKNKIMQKLQNKQEFDQYDIGYRMLKTNNLQDGLSMSDQVKDCAPKTSA